MWSVNWEQTAETKTQKQKEAEFPHLQKPARIKNSDQHLFFHTGRAQVGEAEEKKILGES